MDIKQLMVHSAHIAWARKSAAMGIKGMAALAVGRWPLALCEMAKSRDLRREQRQLTKAGCFEFRAMSSTQKGISGVFVS